MQDKKKESKVKIIRWTNMELECFYGDYMEAVAYARKKAAETGLHQRLGEHLPAFGIGLKHHYALWTRLCSLRHRKSPRYCVESAALIT